MRKWIFELGPFGAVSAPFTQAASPVRAPSLNLETAAVQVAPSPLPDEQSYALSFLRHRNCAAEYCRLLWVWPRLIWPSPASTGGFMCPTMRQNRPPLSIGSRGGQR